MTVKSEYYRVKTLVVSAFLDTKKVEKKLNPFIYNKHCVLTIDTLPDRQKIETKIEY